MTIFQAYSMTDKKLAQAGIEDSGFEAKQILLKITGLTPAGILADYNRPLSEFQLNNLMAIIHQREIHYPLQYILGEWDFYGRSYEVGPGVLIPRADTETTVQAAVEFLKDRPRPLILDLCAGTGCIGITLAKELPGSWVTMVEKFDEALVYTKKNLKKHDAKNCEAVKGDIFEGAGSDKNYDLIISNPPYISDDELKYTSPEIQFEPETALMAKDGGLEFYKAIISNYSGCLADGGAFIFEIGFKQTNAVEQLLKSSGFKNITFKKDLNGIDRAVTALV